MPLVPTAAKRMFENIKEYCADRTGEFDEISPGRKALLEKIADYIAGAKKNGLPVNLVYICTHNSRRSHFGQVWAKVASELCRMRLRSHPER